MIRRREREREREIGDGRAMYAWKSGNAETRSEEGEWRTHKQKQMNEETDENPSPLRHAHLCHSVRLLHAVGLLHTHGRSCSGCCLLLLL